MNCQSCNKRIDYRFLTKCPHCDRDIGQASVSTVKPIPDLNMGQPGESLFSWKHGVLNLAYVLASSLAGLISGAIVLYLAGGIFYLTVFKASDNPSVECARGTAFAMLSILSGAFLGALGGTVFAARSMPFKGVAK